MSCIYSVHVKGTPTVVKNDIEYTKQNVVLEALQQYIDNGNDAEYLIDDSRVDEFRAKIAAAETFRDQLDAALASLAN